MKIKVYSKEPGKISTGANTIVEIDGHKIPYITDMKVYIEAGGLTKVTFEMLGELDLEIDADGLQQVGSKALVHDVRVLSQYETKKV